MNRKFGLLKSVYDNEGNYITTYVKRNKYGVAIGLNGKTLPSSYENYRDMQRDKEFKKEIYSQYDNKKGRY